MFGYTLQVLKIYSLCYVYYRFSIVTEYGYNKNLSLIQLIDNGEVKQDNITKLIILFIIISNHKSTIRICKIIYLSHYNKQFVMNKENNVDVSALFVI